MVTTSPTYAPSSRPAEFPRTPRDDTQRDPEFARTMERVRARKSDGEEEEEGGDASASLFARSSREETPPVPVSAQLQPISAKAPAVASAPPPAGAVPDHAWVNAFDGQANTLVLRLAGQDAALRAVTLSRTAAGLDMTLTAHRAATRRLSDSMDELKEKLKARGVDLRSAVVRDDHDEALEAMADG